MAETVLWKPWPGFQTRALRCGADEALFGGAAGPGKTDVLIACGARYAQHPAARILFLRTSYTDLQDVRDRMFTLYPSLGARWEADPKRWVWPSGATLELGYGETVAEVSRYLGREYTGILFDELGLVKEAMVWHMLRTRLRSTDKTVPLRMRASANPGGPGHAWLKDRYVQSTKGGKIAHTEKLDDGSTWSIAYVPGTAKDNPSLPSSYWAGLAQLPPALRAAMRDGDWDAGLGMLFPEVAGKAGEDRFGTFPEDGKFLPWWDYWGGYDWGFRHPAVFIACCRDGKGITWVLDTQYMHRQSDAEQAANIAGLFTGPNPLPEAIRRKVYAGHDAWYKRAAHASVPETVADVMDRNHIAMSKATLDRAAGTRQVRRLLAEGTLRFRSTVGNRRLLEDLRSLTPDPMMPEAPRKVDADPDTGVGGDDGPDALRYALATVPWAVVSPLPAVHSADDPASALPDWGRKATEPDDDFTDGGQYPQGFA